MGVDSGTRVEIGGLVDYYKATMESGQELGQVWQPSFTMAASALVGASGLTEAVQFQHKLAGVVEAFSKFMSDSSTGVHYLADAALSIADNYASADMDMAAEMTSVADAFTPPPNRSAVTEAAETQMASQREAYFHPQHATENEGLPRPEPRRSAANCVDVTPDQDANNHAKKYEGLETWHPNEPEPVTDFGPHVSVA